MNIEKLIDAQRPLPKGVPARGFVSRVWSNGRLSQELVNADAPYVDAVRRYIRKHRGSWRRCGMIWLWWDAQIWVMHQSWYLFDGVIVRWNNEVAAWSKSLAAWESALQ